MYVVPIIDLVVCTRNRPKRLERLLSGLSLQTRAPRRVIIVDSSDSDESEKICNSSGMQNLTYVHSKPGLPMQRNVGVFMARNQQIGPDFIAFLDDDVELEPDYFAQSLEVLSDSSDIIGLGAYDASLDLKAPGFMLRMLGLRSHSDSGKLLQTGFAIPPYPKTQLEVVDWFPGHSMFFKSSVFDKETFNESIRMYGEDLDFCLRAGRHGKLAASMNLHVRHIQEKSGRDSVIASEAYNAGFRWSLVGNSACHVSAWRQIFATAFLCLGYLLLGILRGSKNSLFHGLGLLVFFYRLALGKKLTQ